MIEFDARNTKPWMKKHPFLARLVILLLLPIAPFIIAGMVVTENREYIQQELSHMFRLVFGRWNM